MEEQRDKVRLQRPIRRCRACYRRSTIYVEEPAVVPFVKNLITSMPQEQERKQVMDLLQLFNLVMQKIFHPNRLQKGKKEGLFDTGAKHSNRPIQTSSSCIGRWAVHHLGHKPK